MVYYSFQTLQNNNQILVQRVMPTIQDLSWDLKASVCIPWLWLSTYNGNTVLWLSSAKWDVATQNPNPSSPTTATVDEIRYIPGLKGERPLPLASHNNQPGIKICPNQGHFGPNSCQDRPPRHATKWECQQRSPQNICHCWTCQDLLDMASSDAESSLPSINRK